VNFLISEIISHGYTQMNADKKRKDPCESAKIRGKKDPRQSAAKE